MYFVYIFVIHFNDGVSSIDYTGQLMNSEFERVWKVVPMACFKVLSHVFSWSD
jgi:hypothetical protein